MMNKLVLPPSERNLENDGPLALSLGNVVVATPSWSNRQNNDPVPDLLRLLGRPQPRFKRERAPVDERTQS